MLLAEQHWVAPVKQFKPREKMKLKLLEQFVLPVNYDQTIEELRAAAGYKFDNKVIVDGCFPDERIEPKRITDGPMTFYVLQPVVSATPYEIIDRMEIEHCVRPATVKDILTVGQHRQDFHMLLGLGSVALISKRIQVPVLFLHAYGPGIGFWDFIETFEPGSPLKYLAIPRAS